MTHTHEEYPRYFIRCEVGNDTFHPVSQETYYWFESRYRWACQRGEWADGSKFHGMGIEGLVHWEVPATEADVISGQH